MNIQMIILLGTCVQNNWIFGMYGDVSFFRTNFSDSPEQLSYTACKVFLKETSAISAIPSVTKLFLPKLSEILTVCAFFLVLTVCTLVNLVINHDKPISIILYCECGDVPQRLQDFYIVMTKKTFP